VRGRAARRVALCRAALRRAASCGLLLVVAACGRPLTPLAPAPLPAAAPSAPSPAGVNSRRVPTHAGPRSDGVSDDDLAALWARQLRVPVDGLRRDQVRDSYTARRDGGIHAALDLLAPRGTPVRAADDGTIGRLADGPVGGIAIYASDPEARFVYYYAHLDRLAVGVAVGRRIAKGDVIGYVGTTGNAPRDTPHLHFQVMKRAAGRAWWSGPPINPMTFFASDGADAPAPAPRIPRSVPDWSWP